MFSTLLFKLWRSVVHTVVSKMHSNEEILFFGHAHMQLSVVGSI